VTANDRAAPDGLVQAPPCSVTTAPPLPAWSDYLSRHPGATLFHDARWGSVMDSAYGNRAYYVTARRADSTVGILLLIRQKSLLFGAHLCSLPYFDASGILADDAQAQGALVAEARRLMQELGAAWVELRESAPLGESLPSRTDKVTLHVALPADPAQLWGDLDAKVRNQVRKAQREGLTVRSGGTEMLDRFYAIYVRTMRDLGSPLHSRRFFRLILGHFAQEVRLFVVSSGDRPVAASLVLRDRRKVIVPWAGSDWRVRFLCANMLLYWTMLEDSCKQGVPCFDFGRSTRDSGTYRFKAQWGAREVPLHWHYLLPPGGEVPDLRPDSPKYRLATAVWRRLPVGVARLVGPCIIGKLS